ncbi:MAG: hypothetical protein WAN86_02250, partial [Hyphomicrobiaceae bacterium]
MGLEHGRTVALRSASTLVLALVLALGLAVASAPAVAQAPGGGWETADPKKADKGPANTTVV